MSRYRIGTSEPRTAGPEAINRSVRVMYDQGRPPDVSAPAEFVTSAVFTATAVFLILLAV